MPSMDYCFECGSTDLSDDGICNDCGFFMCDDRSD